MYGCMDVWMDGSVIGLLEDWSPLHLCVIICMLHAASRRISCPWVVFFFWFFENDMLHRP